MTPSSALNTRPDLGWKSKLIHVSGAMNFLDTVVQDWIGPADLIIYERNAITPRALAFIEYWRGMGKPVCINLDDAYWMLPWSNPARAFWFEREHHGPDGKVVKGGATRMLEEALRKSDGLVAPNRLLLSDYAHLARNGYLLQNYAEERWWLGLPVGPSDEEIEADLGKKGEEAKFPSLRRDPRDGRLDAMPTREHLKKDAGREGRVVLGWGGSLSHYDSWHGSGLFDALAGVVDRHPEVIVLVCGNDRRVCDQIPVPAANKAHQSGVPPELWPRTVRSFDVGLAPLTGIYDQRRSWIKGIEYALAGCPWVGTAGETYGDLTGWSTAKLGLETPEFWEDAIEDVLANLDGEQEAAESLVPRARLDFLASENLDVFARCYGRIMQDFKDEQEGLPGVFKVEKGKETKDGETTDEPENVEPLPGVVRVR